ncbi:Predicted membrane protein [Citrobacter koseri]|uniref:Predicted membrane protein n=1 Tax=Citrobacter koseri TaxID=545 RepID=A0A2X2V9A5_CITKO|nr:Predicted membrane protein [Citrobacter koseri]
MLLATGWRLRHKQPVYALILQGGATGALYLTVFGAFRLWQMLPMTLAFALLVLICAASVGLAILQKALSLAMPGQPWAAILRRCCCRRAAGNYVALFSFYLLAVGRHSCHKASGSTGVSLICWGYYSLSGSAACGASATTGLNTGSTASFS